MRILQGTSLGLFLDNLKELAGTNNYITRAEFDKNPNKVISYSYINKTFGYTWNTLLEKAGLTPKRVWNGVINQGRKMEDKSKYRETSCLRCDALFVSPDPSNFRICNKCKNMVGLEELDD